jgi:DNA mismatch repair protein MutS
MAQAGLFVAAKSFKFSPFDTIISQVDLSDNIFAGKSSFITEMLGLKRILQCAGPRTLVLSDELCRGTEHSSSVGLVSATILQLIKTNTKFFFTSHLHEVPKVQDIIDLKDKLNICHLSVNIKSNNIIYERKLQNGPGSSLYGLEVSKSLLECSELVEKAFKIRNNLIGNETKVKKSKYNTKKIIDKCQICSSTKQLEVDHIVPQMTANENGFLNDSRHKNHISNLCTLCHDCHLNKTLNKIKIHGYKDSINGRFLDWERL